MPLSWPLSTMAMKGLSTTRRRWMTGPTLSRVDSLARGPLCSVVGSFHCFSASVTSVMHRSFTALVALPPSARFLRFAAGAVVPVKHLLNTSFGWTL